MLIEVKSCSIAFGMQKCRVTHKNAQKFQLAKKFNFYCLASALLASQNKNVAKS